MADFAGVETAGMRRATMVICAVLALQASAVLLRVKEYGFPFTDYPMFSSARYEGDRMDDRTIIVTLADGQQVMVGPADVNLDHFQYWRWADAIIRYGASAPADTQRARRGPMSTIGHALGIIRPRLDLVRLFVERYERKQGADVVRLQVEDGMAIVTRDGMRVAAEPRLLRDLELPPDDGAKP